MFSDFVQLHAHSEYSLDVGFCCIEDYVKFCHRKNVKIASITERFNLCSVFKFYKTCINFGIKPIIGCEFFVEYGIHERSKILLLCKSITGYGNLVKLIAKAYSENLKDGVPVIKRSWFLAYSEGIIIIGLSYESDIGMSLLSGRYDDACFYLKFWTNVFKDNFYLSVTRFGISIEFKFLERLFDFLEKNHVLLVATNEVCFLRKTDLFSYRTKIAIFDTDKKVVADMPDIYFKNKYYKLYNEMHLVYSDMPEVLYNSFELAKRCNLRFNLGRDFSPVYPKKINISKESFLVKKSCEKLFNDVGSTNTETWFYYVQRLQIELLVINKIGFADYFLVTHDFIVWAKDNGVFVGPGRGSGSGSLVAYFLSITDIDPIKFDLLFERFLNHERVTIPDFDIDFCIEGRDLVIDYIFDEYGYNKVAHIVTFGCMTIKAAVRDIGRVLGYSYGFIDKVTNLLSEDFGLSLKSELMNNSILKKEYDESYDVQAIINMALNLEGMVKGIGKHAGGLVISRVSLLGKLPIAFDYEDRCYMTQLDKFDAEKFGFIKFDFLGLKTLSVMATVMEAASSFGCLDGYFSVDLNNSSLGDETTYRLIQSGDTIGIFQFESFGIKSVIQCIKPDVFSDLVALVALYRPGPLQSGMLHAYLRRRIGIDPIDYIHPMLESVLSETYGIVVYQEQVMLIAQVFSDYSIASADFLRIAMSKKEPKSMAFHLELFSIGAEKKGIDRNTSKNVFYLVEKFAGYGFNKAHSVGYALLAYNSAWLKANYNTIFMCVLLSSDMYNYSNVELFIEECIHFGIKIFAPDINRSFYCFTMGRDYIYYGIGSLKGVGLSIISEIIHNRSFFGPYSCFFNFLHRIDINLLSKKTLESLIYSGVFNKVYLHKFKLVLIGIKILNLYFKSESFNFYMMSSFIDDYFNYKVQDITFLINYKQKEVVQEKDIVVGYFNHYDFFLKYLQEMQCITDLSYKSGSYFNEFFCGLINKISYKKIYFERYVVLNIIGYNKVFNLFISYYRYQSMKKSLKIGSFIVAIGYTHRGLLKEILIENFYLFRYRFVRYIDLIFYDSFISDLFLSRLCGFLLKKFVIGYTGIRFKFFIKGKCVYFHFNSDLKFALHDDFIYFLSKSKEIKNIEFMYIF